MLLVLNIYFTRKELTNKKNLMTQLNTLGKKLIDWIIKKGGKKAEDYVEKRKKYIESMLFQTVKLANIEKKYLMYYLSKVVSIIILMILSQMIIYTNAVLKKESILSNFMFGSNSISGVSSVSGVTLLGMDEKQFKKLQDEEVNMMVSILKDINESIYYYLDDDKKLMYLQEIINKKYNFSEEETFKIAERAKNKFDLIYRLSTNNRIKVMAYIISTVLGVFLIDFILMIWGKINSEKIKNETETLQDITVLIGDNPNTSVEDILISLRNSSNIFYPYLKEAHFEYLKSANKGLKVLNNVPYKEFRRIASTLSQAQNYDKFKAIANLKKYLERKQKKLRDIEDFEIRKKEMIATFIVVAPLLLLVMLLVYPFMKILTEYS